MTTAVKELNRETNELKEKVVLEKIEIAEESTDVIYRSLRQYGVSRASVFPDLENLGLDISRKWRA